MAFRIVLIGRHKLKIWPNPVFGRRYHLSICGGTMVVLILAHTLHTNTLSQFETHTQTNTKFVNMCRQTQHGQPTPDRTNTGPQAEQLRPKTRCPPHATRRIHATNRTTGPQKHTNTYTPQTRTNPQTKRTHTPVKQILNRDSVCKLENLKQVVPRTRMRKTQTETENDTRHPHQKHRHIASMCDIHRRTNKPSLRWSHHDLQAENQTRTSVIQAPPPTPLQRGYMEISNFIRTPNTERRHCLIMPSRHQNAGRFLVSCHYARNITGNLFGLQPIRLRDEYPTNLFGFIRPHHHSAHSIPAISKNTNGHHLARVDVSEPLVCADRLTSSRAFKRIYEVYTSENARSTYIFGRGKKSAGGISISYFWNNPAKVHYQVPIFTLNLYSIRLGTEYT